MATNPGGIDSVYPDCTGGLASWAEDICQPAAALLLLIVLGPAILLFAISVWMISRRTPFVAHRRVGQHGKPLWVLKIRTMWGPGCPKGIRRGFVEYIAAEPEAEQKLRRDDRIISSLAALYRRYSIDEIPQLIHVLRREMSFVGPRPVTPGEIERYYGAFANRLLSVKPGLTGLWQIGGRSGLDWNRRVELDLLMTQPRRLRTTIAIILRTFPAILSGKGAW